MFLRVLSLIVIIADNYLLFIGFETQTKTKTQKSLKLGLQFKFKQKRNYFFFGIIK